MPRCHHHRERNFAADPGLLAQVSSSSFPARRKSCCPDSSRSTLRSLDFQTFSIRANRSNTVPPVWGVQYRPVFPSLPCSHVQTDTSNPSCDHLLLSARPATAGASEPAGEIACSTDRPAGGGRASIASELISRPPPGSPSRSAVSRHLTAARSRPAGSGGLPPDPERASARGRPPADRPRRRRCGEVVAG
jgi:hypothetical protein